MKSYYVLIYFGTILTAIFLVPIVSRLAKKLHLVDKPDSRKVHHTPIPRVGGVVFVITTLVFIVPGFFLDNYIGESFRESQTQFIVLLAAACFVFIVGFLDDIHSLPGFVKLLSLIAASVAICASSATLQTISIGQWEINTGLISWPLSILWIVVITVGMNFIDGLDGLAAGIAAFVCGTIFVIALLSGQAAMSLLMLVLVGSVTGFLFFNFYPAKIFMGDCGSMFLGFMIGAGSLVCQAKTATFVGLAIPFLVLGIPLIDAAFTMIRRAILYRRSVFSSEMGHIHHYLLDMGLPQLTAVIIIYALTCISACIGLLMLTTSGSWSVLLFAGGLILIFVAFIYLGAARVRETIGAMKRNKTIAQKIKADQICFENVQLRMRHNVSFNDWWESICILAKQMRFNDMEFYLSNNGCSEKKCSWVLEENDNKVDLLSDFTLPIGSKNSETSAHIKLRTSRIDLLEITCRRVALLGRLVDEFPPPEEVFEIEDETVSEQVKRKEKRAIGEPAIMPAAINVMGVPVVPFTSYQQALACIEQTIESNQKSFWVAMNPQKCYRAWHEPELMKVVNQADAGICDGVGISVASKILNGTSIIRCTGCDLFFQIIALAEKKKWRIFLLGASPESNSRAADNLTQQHPELVIAGRHDGFFKDKSEVIEEINASKSDILFVAMGSPKQEYWISKNLDSINVKFCMGIGGSIDVASGTLTRAPKIFQKTGTEFLFQLITEPRKRWPRQKVYFPFLLMVIFKKIFGTALLTGEDGDSSKRRVVKPLASEPQKSNT
ncbi:MAG: WecB/TagA/CpsF family glycosyltransferase [Sedimentisphaerales bacterium]|nr:WecB/TagA/CpsF family glycosyltransferase [Sedimentisphaerales bacterium]